MIVFKEKAKEDIYKAKDYYKNISREVAKKYVSELERTVKSIEKFPDSGSNRYSDYSNDFILKFYILKTFPYMIFYYNPKEGVVIIRVLHMSMDLPHWLYF